MNSYLSKYSLTIIIPAYNEEQNLESVTLPLLKIMKAKLQSFQIIIVNDGSIDNTASIADQLASNHPNHVKVIHQLQNCGIGYSYLNALRDVQTDFVTWLPSDGEISTEGFTELLCNLDLNKVIVTYPEHHKFKRSFFRTLLSKTYSKIFNLSFKMNLKYYNGNSIFPTSILKKQIVLSRRFAFNAEALIHVLKNENLSFIEKPFILEERFNGHSKAIRLDSFIDVLRSYLYLLKLYAFK